MQLKDLVKPIDEQSDEELLAHLRQIRHNREVYKSAVKKRAKKEETKASRGRVSKLEQLLASLPEDEREAFLRQLEDTSGSSAADG